MRFCLFLFYQKTILNGAFYLFIADIFATKNIDGAKELVVLLRLSGNV